MGSCEAGGAGCHSAQVAGRPGEEPCTCHAAGDGPRGPQLKKPVCALSCWEGPCQAAYGPSPPHPAPPRPSSARPAEPEQSPPQVCPESGLPKGVRERTSPARWQQEGRNTGLGREASACPALRSGSGRPHSSPHTAKESRTWPKLRGGLPLSGPITDTCAPHSSAPPRCGHLEGPSLHVHGPVWKLEGRSPKGSSSAKV